MSEGINIPLSATILNKVYSFNSPSGSSGTFYVGGFYNAPVADANLTNLSTTVTIGAANEAHGAHAFIVMGGAGTASGGTGTVEIEVSGTSITEGGVRSASDTEIILADVTTGALNQFLETSKKWIGQLTFTLQNSGGSTHTTFTADFNYGLSKYEDFENRNITITGFEMVGRAGANDSGFNIELLKHPADGSGWTYHATAFVPGNSAIVNMNTDYSTEKNLVSGEKFAYKRTSLSENILGSTAGGVLVKVTTGANNSVEQSNITVTASLT